MKQLSLRGLKSFHEIIQSGSATAAAERLGLSQPGVSRLIAQLERDVGFDLFYREKGRLVPTADGLAVYEEVDLAFSNIERINALVRDIRNHNTGQLKIVASPSFSEGVLADVIVNFLSLSQGAAAYRFAQRRNRQDASCHPGRRLRFRQAAAGSARHPGGKAGHLRHGLRAAAQASAGEEATLSPQQLKDQPLILLGLGQLEPGAGRGRLQKHGSTRW